VVRQEVGGLMEADLTSGTLAEDAVEDDQVEVEVGIQGGAEAVKEGHGAELSLRGRAWARALEGGADGAEEDREDGAGDLWVVVEVGA
jgi:hypothetical protein